MASRMDRTAGAIERSRLLRPLHPVSRRVLNRPLPLPFCYAEAAANLLTNPALDPFGKIPEFKFCAMRAQKAELRSAAE
jgi:hypothetical protein